MTTRDETPTAAGGRPPVTLTASDYEGLSQLARAITTRMPDVGSVLTEELARANVVADGRSPLSVGMGSEVEFRDDITCQDRTVRVVWPREADISQGKVSVLTPIGVALIGLQAGDSITWKTRSEEVRRLTVLAVRPTPLA